MSTVNRNEFLPPFARRKPSLATASRPAGFEPVRAVSRRDFLKAGSVLVVGVSLFGCSQGEAPAGPAGAGRRQFRRHAAKSELRWGPERLGGAAAHHQPGGCCGSRRDEDGNRSVHRTDRRGI